MKHFVWEEQGKTFSINLEFVKYACPGKEDGKLNGRLNVHFDDKDVMIIGPLDIQKKFFAAMRGKKETKND